MTWFLGIYDTGDRPWLLQGPVDRAGLVVGIVVKRRPIPPPDLVLALSLHFLKCHLAAFIQRLRSEPPP